MIEIINVIFLCRELNQLKNNKTNETMGTFKNSQRQTLFLTNLKWNIMQRVLFKMLKKK